MLVKNIWNKIKYLFQDKSTYTTKELHDYLSDYIYETDDTTLNDIMVSEFEQKFNNTKTSCGDEVFQHWLRSIKSKEELLSLQKDLQTIQKSNDTNLITKLLSKVGKQKRGDVVSDLWEGFCIKSFILDKFYLLFFINIIISVCISILYPKYFAISIVFFFLFNFVIYLLTNSKISKVSGSINYVLTLCNSLRKIEKKTNISLSVEFPNYKKFNHLEKYTLFFKDGIGGPESGDIASMFIDYFRIFFCFEIFAFKRTEKFITKNLTDVKKIFYYAGYIDCLINSKNIMANNETCYSKINSSKEISFTEMKHPLLTTSVSQSKSITKGLIITGLNMSGKTTFMKSLGINQLLATSFGFCFAKEFHTNIYKIISSFRINDDMLNGKSRYYAEAYRLLEIKNQIKKENALCLVDEILSGTNSDDRIYGATVILKEFAKQKNSIIIAATHDNKIAEELSDLYTPVYFDGEITYDKIKFDYIIKDGIVSKRNGLLILKLIGLDDKTKS